MAATLIIGEPCGLNSEALYDASNLTPASERLMLQYSVIGAHLIFEAPESQADLKRCLNI